MSRDLQIIVGSHDGIEIPALIRAIEAAYVTWDGKRVRVERGEGPSINGLPRNILAIIPR